MGEALIAVFVVACFVCIWQLFANMSKRQYRKYFLYVSHVVIFSGVMCAALASSECLGSKKAPWGWGAIAVAAFWAWLYVSTSLWIAWDAKEHEYGFSEGTYPLVFVLPFILLPVYLFRAKHAVEACLMLVLVIPSYITVMVMGPVIVLFGPTAFIKPQTAMASNKGQPRCGHLIILMAFGRGDRVDTAVARADQPDPDKQRRGVLARARAG